MKQFAIYFMCFIAGLLLTSALANRKLKKTREYYKDIISGILTEQYQMKMRDSVNVHDTIYLHNPLIKDTIIKIIKTK